MIKKKIYSIILFFTIALFAKSAVTYNIEWKNSIGVTINQSNVTKIDSTAWGNGGASSYNVLNSGVDGFVEYTAVQPTGGQYAFGLSATDQNAHFNSIDFAFHFLNNGRFRILESGRPVTTPSPFGANDKFRIVRTGNEIFYIRYNVATGNSILLRTVAINNANSLFIDLAINTQGYTFSNVIASFCAPITIDAGSDVSICYGKSLTLGSSPTASGGFGPISYFWNPVDGLNSADVPNPVAAPSTTTEYAVFARNLTRCGTDKVTVTIQPLPIANAGQDVSICLNNSTTLQASGGIDYSWYPENGLSSTIIANPIANPSTNTTYNVIVTDVNGCSNSDSVNIMINPLPVISITSDNSSIGVTQEWVQKYNGIDSLYDYATEVDAHGCIFVGGTTQNNQSQNDFVIIKYSPAGSTEWVKTYNGPNNGYDYLTGIITDNNCNLYVTGISQGSGTQDVVTIKYDSLGNIVWEKRYSNGNSNSANITLDNNNNVYVLGTTYGISYPTIFIIKYDANGNLVLTKTDGIENSNIEATKLQVDDAGNIYLLGYISGNLERILLTKYNSDGIKIWEQQFDSPQLSGEFARDISIDGHGNIYLIGQGHNDTSFVDVLLLKYDNSGILKWSKQFDVQNNSYDHGVGLEIAGDNNIYISGITGSSKQNSSILISKYDSLGNRVWIRLLPNAYSKSDKMFASDNLGNVYVTGVYIRNDSSDIYTAKVNSAGDLVWEIRYNGIANSYDFGYAIAIDGNDNVFSVGGSEGIGTQSDMVTIKYHQSQDNSALTICLGDTVSLTTPVSSGTPPYTFTWSPSAGLSCTNCASPNANPETTTIYTITVTDVNGCSDNEFFTVNIDPGPKVNIGDDLTICSGSSVTLNAGSKEGVKFNWSPSEGLSNTTIANPIATPMTTTTYSVIVFNSSGCTTSDEVTVNVNPLPEILSNVTLEWAKKYAVSDSLSSVSFEVDAEGCIYVSGISTNNGTGKKEIVTIKYSRSGTQEWVQTFENPGADILASTVVPFVKQKIKIDASCNVFVGFTYASSPEANKDIYVIKYDSLGNRQWIASYNGENNDLFTGIELNNSGDVFISGACSNPNTNQNAFLIVKYNSAGIQQWADLYDNGIATSLVVDKNGNVYATGLIENLNGNSDFITVKYNSSGSRLWTRNYNGTDNLEDAAYVIALDTSENIYVSGQTGTNANGKDVLTIKYNKDGLQQWASVYGDTSTNGNTDNKDDIVSSMKTDANGNVYIAGNSGFLTNGFLRDLFIQSGFLPTEVQPLIPDIDIRLYNAMFTMKYNADGGQEWIVPEPFRVINNGQQNFSITLNTSTDLALDKKGNPYVTGYQFFQNLSFQNNEFNFSFGSRFLTNKYSTSGSKKWSRSYTDNIYSFNPEQNVNYTISSAVPYGIGIAAENQVYVTGGSSTGNAFSMTSLKYSDVSNNKVVCKGEAVVLNPIISSGTTPYSFLWNPSDGLSCSNCNNPIANPNSTTTYTMTVSDANGCSTTSDITVTVNEFSVTADIQQETNDTTGAISLHVQCGKPPYEFVWDKVKLPTREEFYQLINENPLFDSLQVDTVIYNQLDSLRENPNMNNLAAGKHTVRINDQRSDSVLANITVGVELKWDSISGVAVSTSSVPPVKLGDTLFLSSTGTTIESSSIITNALPGAISGGFISSQNFFESNEYGAIDFMLPDTTTSKAIGFLLDGTLPSSDYRNMQHAFVFKGSTVSVYEKAFNLIRSDYPTGTILPNQQRAISYAASLPGGTSEPIHTELSPTENGDSTFLAVESFSEITAQQNTSFNISLEGDNIVNSPSGSISSPLLFVGNYKPGDIFTIENIFDTSGTTMSWDNTSFRRSALPGSPSNEGNLINPTGIHYIVYKQNGRIIHVTRTRTCFLNSGSDINSGNLNQDGFDIGLVSTRFLSAADADIAFTSEPTPNTLTSFSEVEETTTLPHAHDLLAARTTEESCSQRYFLSIAMGSVGARVKNVVAVAKKGQPQITANITDVSCGLTCSGAINLSILGPQKYVYTYSWSGPNVSGVNTQNISNLCKGVYTLTLGYKPVFFGNYQYITQSFEVGYKVQWTQIVNSTVLTNNLNSLQKTSTSLAWDAGAISQNDLQPVPASSFFEWAEFTYPITNFYGDIFFGFSDPQNSNTSFNTISHNGVLVVGPFVGAVNAGTVSGLLGFTNPNDVLRVARAGFNLLEIYINSILIYQMPVTLPPPPSPSFIQRTLYVDASIYNLNETVFHPRASFGCPDNPVYAVPENGLDGTYYKTYSKKLYFKYDELYRNGVMNLKIYDSQHNLMPASASLLKKYGLNWFILDLSTVPQFVLNQKYVLEVESDKGQKEVLRFVFD